MIGCDSVLRGMECSGLGWDGWDWDCDCFWGAFPSKSE